MELEYLPIAILKNMLANSSDKCLPCLVSMLDVKNLSHKGKRITGFGKFHFLGVFFFFVVVVVFCFFFFFLI